MGSRKSPWLKEDHRVPKRIRNSDIKQFLYRQRTEVVISIEIAFCRICQNRASRRKMDTTFFEETRKLSLRVAQKRKAIKLMTLNLQIWCNLSAPSLTQKLRSCTKMKNFWPKIGKWETVFRRWGEENPPSALQIWDVKEVSFLLSSSHTSWTSSWLRCALQINW